jgi:hypothetical protein
MTDQILPNLKCLAKYPIGHADGSRNRLLEPCLEISPLPSRPDCEPARGVVEATSLEVGHAEFTCPTKARSHGFPAHCNTMIRLPMFCVCVSPIAGRSLGGSHVHTRYGVVEPPGNSPVER